jgi:hypothetical protein
VFTLSSTSAELFRNEFMPILIDWREKVDARIAASNWVLLEWEAFLLP